MSFICFNNVSKSFGKNNVIDNVSFELRKGESCGFIGRNGSGKTVIFKLMSGLLIPDSGSVTINGEDYSKKGKFFSSMGVMIETPGFIPYYSGLKNLKILNSLSDNPVSVSEICALMERLGLNAKNRGAVATYSLGMRQKLGIIQAVMNKPELLILDEPMNSLDKESVYEIRKLLLELNNAGTTIVVASHISDDISALCGRIFRVEDKTLKELSTGILRV